MRCCFVRLLLVAMLATQHTDFESFTNALGALPNQPPVPMACEPSPSPIDVDTRAIVQQVVDVLLKHSPSPSVHLEVLGRRWLALARNESVSNLTSTLLPAKARVTWGLLSSLGGFVIRIRIPCIAHVSCVYPACILMCPVHIHQDTSTIKIHRDTFVS